MFTRLAGKDDLAARKYEDVKTLVAAAFVLVTLTACTHQAADRKQTTTESTTVVDTSGHRTDVSSTSQK